MLWSMRWQSLKMIIFLTEMQLPKGSMTLIDEDKFLKISEYFSRMETHLANGGSAGNAIGQWHALVRVRDSSEK